MAHLTYAPEIIALFESRIDRSGECHLWTKGVTNKGYGNMLVTRKPAPRRQMSTHRFAWLLVNGDPGELHVLHTCDTPRCVRVEHLFLGTNDDNVADKVAKRRQSVGVPTNATITQAVADEIRSVWAHGGLTQAELGGQYGLGRRTIGDIVNGVSWRLQA